MDLTDKTLKHSSSKHQLLSIMGYKDVNQYITLSKTLDDNLTKFHEKYPEFKKLDTQEEHKVLQEATNQLLKRQYRSDKLFNIKISSSCSADLEGCLSDVSSSFDRTTFMCISTGAYNLIGGLICQSANVMIYETEKYNCTIAYEECLRNPEE